MYILFKDEIQYNLSVFLKKIKPKFKPINILEDTMAQKTNVPSGL